MIQNSGQLIDRFLFLNKKNFFGEGVGKGVGIQIRTSSGW